MYISISVIVSFLTTVLALSCCFSSNFYYQAKFALGWSVTLIRFRQVLGVVTEVQDLSKAKDAKQDPYDKDYLDS